MQKCCEYLLFSAVSCTLHVHESPGEGVNLRKSAVSSKICVLGSVYPLNRALGLSLRAQRLKTIQDRSPGLKFSSESENFKQATDQTPIFKRD